MPCSDGTDYNGYSSSYGNLNWIEAENARQRLDNVTRILCETIKLIENTDHSYNGKKWMTYLINNVGGLHTWYLEHQERDRQRLKAEAEADRKRQIIREARSKLTAEELMVLGL